MPRISERRAEARPRCTEKTIMRFLPIAAGVLAAVASVDASVGAAADPARLLAPDDPATRSGWRPPASPTADLKAYRPVDAKAWPEPGGAGQPAKPTKEMPGMMKGMPGMEPGQ